MNAGLDAPRRPLPAFPRMAAGARAREYEIAVVQSRFFEVSWGPIGRIVFLVVAAAFLTDGWLATADGVSRMHADVLHISFRGAGEFRFGAGTSAAWAF